jgi:hypothetical protein
MTGSDVNDPRAKLTPGIYNAGEAAMGMKHLVLVKKPDAFQLGSSDPDDPKVLKTLGQLRMGNLAKIPKPARLLLAQLAFANSDLAFQGNHLFQGNFYGVSIYDIANPANAKLLTTVVCPGGHAEWPRGLRHTRFSAGPAPDSRGGKRQETPASVSTKRPFPRRKDF